MPKAIKPTLQPRKTPVQARSVASVDAILQATIQVLMAVGKERLTTTRVAERAGVSVGTLYQYFPNKSALLQACLRRHMEGVSSAIESICSDHRGDTLREMGSALVGAYLAAKMHNVPESVTLYAVSSDADGAAISKAASARSRRFVAAMFASAREGLKKDPDLVASVTLDILNGLARRVLEAKSPTRELELLRAEIDASVRAYLCTCV